MYSFGKRTQKNENGHLQQWWITSQDFLSFQFSLTYCVIYVTWEINAMSDHVKLHATVSAVSGICSAVSSNLQTHGQQSVPHSTGPANQPAELTGQTFLAEPFLQTLLSGSSQGICKLLSSSGIRWPYYCLGSKFIPEQRHLSAAAFSTHQKKCQVFHKLVRVYQAISSSLINCPD